MNIKTINGVTTIYPMQGCVLRRKSDNAIFKAPLSLGYIHYLNNVKLDIPHMEIPEDYDDAIRVTFDNEPMYIRCDDYENMVDELIRLKYTMSQELAILRQRDTKPDEFSIYNEYCEHCKRFAKRVLYMGMKD